MGIQIIVELLLDSDRRWSSRRTASGDNSCLDHSAIVLLILVGRIARKPMCWLDYRFGLDTPILGSSIVGFQLSAKWAQLAQLKIGTRRTTLRSHRQQWSLCLIQALQVRDRVLVERRKCNPEMHCANTTSGCRSNAWAGFSSTGMRMQALAPDPLNTDENKPY